MAPIADLPPALYLAVGVAALASFDSGSGRTRLGAEKVIMNLDNPEVPEFAAWSSYWRFAERVRRERRYVSDNQIAAFLATAIATNKD